MRQHKPLFCFLALVALATLPENSAAQSLSISAPKVGVFFDASSGSLRTLWGVGAISRFDSPAGEAGLATAFVAPSQSWALGVPSATAPPVILRAVSGRQGWRRLALHGAAPGARLAAFSPSGASVALTSPDGMVATIVAGLPDAAAPVGTVDLAGIPSPSGWALSEDSSMLAAISGTNVFLIRQNKAPISIYAGVHPASISFLSGSHDLALADSGSSRLLILSGIDQGAVQTVLASDADGLLQPSVAAPDDSGSFVFAVDGNSVWRVAVRGGQKVRLVCGCSISGLRRLQSGGTLALTELAGGHVWIADFNRPDALVFDLYVPAAGPSPAEVR